MARRYSVAEARAQLPTLLDAVEHGEDIEITRRGRPVAFLVSGPEYARLKGLHRGFAEAFRAWRESVDEDDLEPDPFGDVRDRSPGRPVRF